MTEYLAHLSGGILPAMLAAFAFAAGFAGAGYGFLRRTECGYEPAIVVCPAGEPLDLLPEEDRAELQAMRDKVVAVMRELREIAVDGFGTLMRGYILAEALASGWLTYEEGKTPATVGAYLYR